MTTSPSCGPPLLTSGEGHWLCYPQSQRIFRDWISLRHQSLSGHPTNVGVNDAIALFDFSRPGLLGKKMTAVQVRAPLVSWIVESET